MKMDIDVPEIQKENEQTEQQNENSTLKRKTHVGCWKNKKEFIQVYSWLFDDQHAQNRDATHKALKQMKIWKLRRLNLTPASVLSTIVLIEVQLKDDVSSKINLPNSDDLNNELKILYSSSFIRFFNYMSSIMQSKNFKSMYDIAKELGIESFIVDLRHLCSHGQLMPELSILRNALKYCIKWLKQYYWDKELNNMIDVTSDNIRLNDLTQLDNNITNLFQLYDTVLELRLKNCKMIGDGRKLINNKFCYNKLKTYSNEKNMKNLISLSKFIIKDLSTIIKREPGCKDLSQLYIEAILKMNFFFESAANHLEKNLEISDLISFNQNLFKSIANHGFLEELFLNLILICENENEEYYKRRGSGFWAGKITEGFIAFKKLKVYYKKKKDKDENILSNAISTNSTYKNIAKIYSKKLSIDCNTTLIFSDSFRRPWSLQFNYEYIQERINKINLFTKETVISCLVLLNPPLSKQQHRQLIKLIEIYSENESNGNSNMVTPGVDNNLYYIKDGCIVTGDSDGSVHCNIDDNANEKKIGIWSIMSDNQNWSAYPLGRLIWE